MQRRVLKATPRRSVLLEEADGDSRVVKRFHAPARGALGRAWSRCRDRLRARREGRRLSAARARGLPVPRPLGVRSGPAGPELMLEAVPGARTLTDWLGQRPAPRVVARLGRRLGELLARAQAAGVTHGDPHLGNLLLDDAGAPWVVDGAALRVGRPRPRGARSVSELVDWAAALRDEVSPALRAHALRGWSRGAGVAADARTDERALREDLEARARVRRREIVARRVEVWRRASSNTVVEAGGLVRRVGAADSPADLVVEGAGADGAWATAVRLLHHRISAATPVALAPGQRARLAPAGAATGDPRTAALGRRDARALGALLGALLDRGLLLPGDALPGALRHDGALGTWSLGALESLEPAGGADLGAQLDALARHPAAREWARAASPATRAALAVGVLAAAHGTARERSALRAALCAAGGSA